LASSSPADTSTASPQGPSPRTTSSPSVVSWRSSSTEGTEPRSSPGASRQAAHSGQGPSGTTALQADVAGPATWVLLSSAVCGIEFTQERQARQRCCEHGRSVDRPCESRSPHSRLRTAGPAAACRQGGEKRRLRCTRSSEQAAAALGTMNEA
jgi:hypothetical protein